MNLYRYEKKDGECDYVAAETMAEAAKFLSEEVEIEPQSMTLIGTCWIVSTGD